MINECPFCECKDVIVEELNNAPIKHSLFDALIIVNDAIDWSKQ